MESTDAKAECVAYLPLARRTARNFARRFPGTDPNEAFSDAQLALLTAWDKYDATRGSKRQFLTKAIFRRMYDGLRQRLRRTEKEREAARSESVSHHFEYDDRELFEQFRPLLTDVQFSLLYGKCFEGRTIRDMAVDLGLPERRAYFEQNKAFDVVRGTLQRCA